MEFKCNFCLFCLSISKPKLEKVEVNELVNWKKRKCSIQFLVKYLVQSRVNSYDGVLEDILRLPGAVGGDEGGNDVGGEYCSELSTSSVIQICEGCEFAAGNILELHLELEKLQMRIVDQVKSVREGILKCSGWLGGIGGGKEANIKKDFNRFSEKFCGGDGSSKSKRIFDSLKTFQVAVTETSKESVHVPLVYLEKYGLIGNPHSYLLEERAAEAEIKTEPPSPSPDNLIDSYEDDDADDDDQDNMSDLSWDPSEAVEVKLEESGFAKKQLGTSRKTKTSSKPIKVPKTRKVRHQYSCQSCLSKFKRISSFEHHLREHETTKKFYHCDLCNLGFSTKQHFTLHEDRHKGRSKMKCDFCQNFIPAFELHSHMKTHVDKIYPCLCCSQVSSSMDKYIAHVLQNHSQAGVEWSCEICETGKFSTRKGYLDHLDQLHRAIDKIKCDFEGCGKSFLNQESLKAHKIHHTDRFACEECFRCFSTQTNLEVHQRTHAKNKPIKCDHCPETFRVNEALQTHMIREHGADKLKCGICGKEYTSPSGLHFHMVMSHDGTGKICPVCDKKCATVYKLKLHMDSHADPEQKNYLCEECGKSFRSIEGYRNHRRIHEEKKFQCSFCPKTFHMGKYLRQHLQSHTGEKSHICDLCGKGLNRIETLINHRKLCESRPADQRVRKKRVVEPPTKKRSKPGPEECICDVCGKVFRTRRHCQKHKRTHDEKKFKCPHCPNSFAIKKYMIRHIRTHTGEKPYQCDGCGKAFGHDGTLSAHRRKCQVQSSRLGSHSEKVPAS